MAKSRALIAALIYGSAASAAIVAVIAAVANWNYGWMTFASWLVIGFVANLIAASTFGLAWHAFASRRGWRGPAVYVFPAALLGLAVPVCLFTLPPLLGGGVLDISSLTYFITITGIIGVALGGFTGLFAWLIRRPDRDAPANPPTSTS